MENLRLIDRVYDTLLEERGALPELLADIANHAGAHTAGFSLISPTDRWGMSTVPRVDPDRVNDHLLNWAKMDLAFDLLEALPVQHIGGLGADDLAHFKRSPAYQESWRNSGMGAQRRFAKLHASRNLCVVFTLHAGKQRDEIDPDGDRLYASLLPHIARATRLLHRQRQLQLEYHSGGFKNDPEITGIFYTGANGMLIHADAGGEDLLKREDCFILNQTQCLTLKSPRSNARLQDALYHCASAATARETMIRVESSSASGFLTAEILPFPTGTFSNDLECWPCERCKAIIIVRDPAKHRLHMTDFLRSTYGLTYSEALLTVEILKGDGRANAAARCGIKLNTARAHLRNIYSKMNISRQAELIALVRDRYQH